MGQLGFAFRGISESGPIIDKVLGNQVNVATRQSGISDISGDGEWGNKNWPEECSIVIDTGFNGGGLRSFSWLRGYLGYIERVATLRRT